MQFGEYEVIRLRQEDCDKSQDNVRQAMEICDTYLGKGLYSEELLRELGKKDGHYFYLIMKENDVLGIFYCYGDSLNNISFLKGITIPGLSSHTRIGVAQSIAFREEMRTTGLSEKMLQYGTSIMFKHEQVKVVLVPAWIKNGFVPAQKHLEKCGYRLLMELEKPWMHCQGLECPVCMHSPCICNAALYIKERGENYGTAETL